MRHTADIAIIGGGIAGASLAAAIGDRARTVLLEAEPRLFQHTSSRSAQQMQPTYGPAPVRALTAASMPLVAEIARTIGAPILTSRPLLWLDYGETRDAFDEVLATVAGLDEIGPDAAVRLLPPLDRAQLKGAALDPAALEVDVPALLAAYLASAVAAGCRVLTDAGVRSAERIGDVWRLTTPAGEVEAPVVVDAAGAWADPLAEAFGAHRREVVPHRRTVAVAPAGRPVDPAWPMAHDVGTSFYFRPRGTQILASVLEDEPSEPEDARARPETVETILAAVNALTDLGLHDPAETWTGLRTLSADALPVVGRDPDVDGFYWLAGQGGYGIQTSAGLAAVVAADVLGLPHGLPGLDGVLAALAPDRTMVPSDH